MKCTRCKWYNNKQGINCVPFYGNPNADIVIMGEAFGYEESLKGEPFVGKSGTQVLDKVLNHLNLSRRDLAILNAVRCYQPGNPTPTYKEMDSCFIYTYQDIQQIKPKIIIACGASALYQATGKKGEISKWRGRVLWSNKLQCRVMPTFHPAYILRNRTKFIEFSDDFELAVNSMNADIEKIKHSEYVKIHSFSELLDYRSTLRNSEELYFDLETSALNPYKDHINLIQIGSDDGTILVIENTIVEENIRNLFSELFHTKKCIGQGWEFDAKFLKMHHDIFPTHWHFDTCLAEYWISGQKNNTLTDLTAKYVPEMVGYDEEVYEVGGAHIMWLIDKEKTMQYGADDVYVMYKIKKEQDKLLSEMGMSEAFYNLCMPANKTLTKMSLKGVQFDVDLLKDTDNKYREEGEKALNKIYGLKKVKECQDYFRRKFNPKSSQMVHHLLLTIYGLPVIKFKKDTDKSRALQDPKKYATIGHTELKRYAEMGNPYAKHMSGYRNLEVIRSNFLSGMFPKLINGVAHTTYSLHSTSTGRPNSKNPNLLNLPAKKDIKRCVVARPGHQFVYGDFAQLEVRIAAVVYDEPLLINICNDLEKDFHSSITAQAYDKPYDYVYNGYINGDDDITELRRKGKSVTFGVTYQEGADALAYTLKLNINQAQELIDNFYDRFPSLRDNINKTKRLVLRQGWLVNYFGFRRRWKINRNIPNNFIGDEQEYLMRQNHNILREGVNFLVQSPAWNILELGMIAIDKEIEKRDLKAEQVLQVYDSLCIETPDEEVDEVAELMKDKMENCLLPYEGLNKVKMKVDVEVGKNLADLQKYTF